MDEDELLKVIQGLPNKQCASDPMPTWLLKKISRMILPFVKSMVNQSFFEEMSQCFGTRLTVEKT